MLSTGQQAILHALDARETGAKVGQWICRCPCTDKHKHDDKNRSLSILLGDDGWLHPFCRACNSHRDEIRAASRFPVQCWSPGVHGRHPPKRTRPVLTDTYPYYDARGRLLYEVCRYEPKTFRRRRPWGGGYAWSLEAGEYVEVRSGTWLPRTQAKDVADKPVAILPKCDLVPYRLLDWASTVDTQPVGICEGEKDCEAAALLRLRTTTLPGGATEEAYDLLGKYLRGRRVWIAPHNDNEGRNRCAKVIAALIKHGATEFRILDFSSKPAGFDLYDLVTDFSGSVGWPTEDREAIKTIRGDVIATLREAPAYRLSTNHESAV